MLKKKKFKQKEYEDMRCSETRKPSTGCLGQGKRNEKRRERRDERTVWSRGDDTNKKRPANV